VRELEVTEDGRILHEGVDITWNDRAIAQAIREWVAWITREEDETT